MSDEHDKPDTKRRGASRYTTMALAAAMLLFAAYMGAYYALLDGSVRRFTWAARGLPFARDVIPTYRYSVPFIERLLAPANEIDRKLRPEKWPGSRTPVPNTKT